MHKGNKQVAEEYMPYVSTYLRFKSVQSNTRYCVCM